jgi:hypothetical protein
MMTLTGLKPIAGVLGLCVLSHASRWCSERTLAQSPSFLAPMIAPPAARSPSGSALHAAYRYRTQVRLTVNRDLEAWESELKTLEAWDSQARSLGTFSAETCRLQAMAADRSGRLHRAEAYALQAAALARTPGETGKAAELLILIEHELGHHDREVEWAGTLSALQPQDSRTLMVIRTVTARHGRRGR